MLTFDFKHPFHWKWECFMKKCKLFNEFLRLSLVSGPHASLRYQSGVWLWLQSPTKVSRLDYRVNDHEDTEKYFAPGCTKVFRTLIKYFGFPLWIIKGLPSLECWFEYLMLNFMTILSLQISSKNHNVISNWQFDHGQLIGGLISTCEIFTKLDKSAAHVNLALC